MTDKFKLHTDSFNNKDFLISDEKYLNDLILLSPSEIKQLVSEENWFFWNEKNKIEEELLKDPYNMHLNFKAYAFDIAIVNRLCILKTLYNPGSSILNVSHAFRLSSRDIMVQELIKPLDRKVIEEMGSPPGFFGRGTVSAYAKEAGYMNCICVKEHDQSLYYWLKARDEGFFSSSHILLHIDAHSDMTLISPEDLELLKNITKSEELKNYIASFYSGSNSLITPVNLTSFIHYAVYCGLVREIFWVYPDPDYCKYRLPANIDRTFLLDIEGGHDFSLENGHVICQWEGIKVHIIRLSELPVFTEEVILDIDMDFFLNEASADGKSGCRGYRIRNREDIDLWQKLVSYRLKIGNLKPWISPETFTSIIKSKHIFSPVTTLCLSPFFMPEEWHFLINILIKELSVTD
ncbi:MAG: UPF0489 family protein [Candidatus Eremiobacterota bacterium]